MERGNQEKMIPTIIETDVKDDWLYEDDNEVRIIHGLDKAMTYAHPSTRKNIGVKIKDKVI
jgi:hypothetical protein